MFRLENATILFLITLQGIFLRAEFISGPRWNIWVDGVKLCDFSVPGYLWRLTVNNLFPPPSPVLRQYIVLWRSLLSFRVFQESPGSPPCLKTLSFLSANPTFASFPFFPSSSLAKLASSLPFLVLFFSILFNLSTHFYHDCPFYHCFPYPSFPNFPFHLPVFSVPVSFPFSFFFCQLFVLTFPPFFPCVLSFLVFLFYSYLSKHLKGKKLTQGKKKTVITGP